MKSIMAEGYVASSTSTEHFYYISSTDAFVYYSRYLVFHPHKYLMSLYVCSSSRFIIYLFFNPLIVNDIKDVQIKRTLLHYKS